MAFSHLRVVGWARYACRTPAAIDFYQGIKKFKINQIFFLF